MEGCIFCAKRDTELICENELAKAFYDKFPVNEGHVLVVPKRHVSDFFEATPEEISAMNELVFQVKFILGARYNPDGYNIGINVGAAAGQTIFHLHLHIIPRYKGDVPDPRGGIRRIKKSMVPYPEEGESQAKVYNKLVRDKIPGIIEASGKIARVRIADDAEYQTLLYQKLSEEVNELLENNDPEELADIIEVILSLSKTYRISLTELLEMAEKKRVERGGFERKIILLDVQC